MAKILLHVLPYLWHFILTIVLPQTRAPLVRRHKSQVTCMGLKPVALFCYLGLPISVPFSFQFNGFQSTPANSQKSRHPNLRNCRKVQADSLKINFYTDERARFIRCRERFIYTYSFYTKALIWKALTNHNSSPQTVLQHFCGARMNGFVLRRFSGNHSWPTAWEKKKFPFAWSEKIGNSCVHSLAEAKCELRR